MNFTTKKRALSNLPTSSVSGKKTATCVLCHSTRSFGNEPLVPSIDLQNQENVIIVFQNVIKAKESERKYSFGKNIIFFKIVPPIFLISINILFALFFYFVLLISQDQNLRNLSSQTLKNQFFWNHIRARLNNSKSLGL